MLNHFCNFFWIDCVEQIEEESPINLPALGKPVWQVQFELRIIFVMLKNILDIQLRVVRDIDVFDINHLYQSLAFSKDILEEVLRDVVEGRNIVLDYI